jgi:hypothetical protein
MALTDDLSKTLTSKEGWARFVATAPVKPEQADDRAALTESERLDDDERRLDYLSNPITVGTPVIDKAIKTVRRLLILNRHQYSARRGLILSGDGGTGKTTTLSQLGRTYELALRRTEPDASSIPVVYITLPTAATARMLAVEFARFLGLPVGRRANLTDITESVCAVLCDVGCRLVLVDELHNLSISTPSGAEVSDHLKYFSERIPATFVYAGIDLEGRGLFNGTRGKQIASRFTMVNTRAFAYGTEAQRETWRSLVATFEQALCLYRHVPGTLSRHSEYLYCRTGGMMGSLSHLVRGAAIDAICDGSERITKPHLAAIDLDLTATQSYAQSRKRKST